MVSGVGGVGIGRKINIYRSVLILPYDISGQDHNGIAAEDEFPCQLFGIANDHGLTVIPLSYAPNMEASVRTQITLQLV